MILVTSVNKVLATFGGAIACLVMTVLALEFTDEFFTVTTGIEAMLATIVPLTFGFGTVLFLILGVIAAVNLGKG